jgi:DNA-directed RNA polymerase subunit beta'
LEVSALKSSAVIAPFDGTIHFSEKWADRYINIESDYKKKPYIAKEWYDIIVKKWDELKKGASYASKWNNKLKVSEWWTVLEIKDDGIVLWVKETEKKSYKWLDLMNWIEEGAKVYRWQVLTNWPIDIPEYKEILWDLQAQKYIIREVKKVYSDQWQWLNDKHIEIVVKQMFSKVFIENPGESSFIPWTYVTYEDFIKTNNEIKENWQIPAEWKRLVLWLSKTILKSDSDCSWLSAASFQETVRAMVWASLRWAVDTLSDLKSNVIIWRLLPVWEHYRKENWFE